MNVCIYRYMSQVCELVFHQSVFNDELLMQTLQQFKTVQVEKLYDEQITLSYSA